MTDDTQSPTEPARETIVVAHGPNVDGQHHQAIAAQGDEATRRELVERAMQVAEDTARGIEAGEGDEEGITERITEGNTARDDASSPAEER